MLQIPFSPARASFCLLDTPQVRFRLRMAVPATDIFQKEYGMLWPSWIHDLEVC